MSTYRRNGYAMVYMPKHHRASTDGMVYEHIVVAEKSIGRILEPQEVVHHEDRIRDNNSPENLFVFKNEAYHTMYHSSGIMIALEDGSYISSSLVVDLGSSKVGNIRNILVKICSECASQYEAYDSKSRFCSQKCCQLSSRRVERPSAEELRNLISENSYCAIGRMYGVSDNAIRKWVKYYNIII